MLYRLFSYLLYSLLMAALLITSLLMVPLLRGKRSKKIKGPITSATTSPVNSVFCNRKADQHTDKTMVNNAMRFAFLGILLCCCQSIIKGPKVLFASNFFCIRGDDLAKQAAAIIKKTVVGSTGNIAPNIAKPTQNSPVTFNKSILALLCTDGETGQELILIFAFSLTSPSVLITLSMYEYSLVQLLIAGVSFNFHFVVSITTLTN